MSDLISRKAAIEALAKAGCINYEATGDTYGMITAINVIKGMPRFCPSVVISAAGIPFITFIAVIIP